jgi:SPP1 family predicted phage head-tail adaptor
MIIGDLHHKITIQEQRGSVNDGGGNKIPNWVEVATVWANVTPTNGQTSVLVGKDTQQITHTVKMRYRAISKANRLLFNGRVLKIQYIINVNERNRELRLNCLEV